MSATDGVHSRDRILRAAAAWVWAPRGSEQDDTELRLVRYPSRLGGGVRGSLVTSHADPATIVDHALERTASWGERVFTFWTSGADSPGLEDELRRRGAEHVDTVAVFARPIAGVEMAVPQNVSAEVVRTLGQVREVDAINVPVWNQTPLDEGGLRDELHDVVSALDAGTGLQVLARIDGVAVSAGGCTIVDGFTRLWGAATLESSRGRGAYRAVLAERLRSSAELGATTALVKGRVSTSAPVLARAGFEHYGDERAYRLLV